MFGISLQKLLVLIGVLIAVWGFFNYAAKQKKLRERREQDRAELARRQAHAAAAGPAAQAAAGAKVEEMGVCAVCGAYVATGSKSCGKAACPYL